MAFNEVSGLSQHDPGVSKALQLVSKMFQDVAGGFWGPQNHIKRLRGFQGSCRESKGRFRRSYES